MEPYEHLQPPVYHFDLYRLADPEELEFMGIRDYLTGNSVCLVEWPDKGRGILSAPDVLIDIEITGKEREIHCHAQTEVGKQLLIGLTD